MNHPLKMNQFHGSLHYKIIIGHEHIYMQEYNLSELQIAFPKK
jgi:hypothetical protein